MASKTLKRINIKLLAYPHWQQERLKRFPKNQAKGRIVKGQTDRGRFL